MNESTIRPWGGFTVLDEGAGFKVKRIWVNPGGILSLQLHNHRNERWVIVNGTGEVTLDEAKISQTKGDAMFIPVKAKHRVANLGSTLLEFIEVQLGDYLGEDDIVRFDDKYGRSDIQRA